jgi:quercetin dioxygenase-like cupin family protein
MGRLIASENSMPSQLSWFENALEKAVQNLTPKAEELRSATVREEVMRVHKACIVLVLVAGIPAGAYAQSTQPVVKFPNELEFKAPLTPGPQTAVLYGDPTKAGVFVTRVKLAPGLKVMPHWHPDEWRTAVVLSGTLYFGLGEQWDESKLKAYPAGTFFSEPSKTPHYVWEKDGEVIIQITGMGPTGTTPIPQKQ